MGMPGTPCVLKTKRRHDGAVAVGASARRPPPSQTAATAFVSPTSFSEPQSIRPGTNRATFGVTLTALARPLGVVPVQYVEHCNREFTVQYCAVQNVERRSSLFEVFFFPYGAVELTCDTPLVLQNGEEASPI